MSRRVVLRAPGVALRLDLRTVAVSAALLAAAAVVAAVTVVAAGNRIPVADILEVLGGGGRRADRFVLLDLRLPRVSLALLAGAALAGILVLLGTESLAAVAAGAVLGPLAFAGVLAVSGEVRREDLRELAGAVAAVRGRLQPRSR